MVAYSWEWKQELAAHKHKGTTWGDIRVLKLGCGDGHPTPYTE